MQVSQVANDRFVLELPPADASWRPLKDPEVLAETAAWLWGFGPTPLVAVVGYSGAAPKWLSGWNTSVVRWAPGGAPSGAGVIIASRADLERFLSEGAPHEQTVLLWPRTDERRTFEALRFGNQAWLSTVDAHAQIQRAGEVFEVSQVNA